MHPALRLHSRKLVVLAIFGLASCVPRHHGPVAGGRLSVGAESFAEDGPFRVVFAGPKGETRAPAEVTLSFSRPMHALSPLPDAPAEASGPARITRAAGGAAVAGTWRWFGERTAVFWPKSTFTPATEFRVDIDRGTRALDGASLAHTPEDSFTFSSARPELDSVLYEYDLAADQHIVTLDFTQAIAHAETRRAIRIEGRDRTKKLQNVPFHVIGEGPDDRAHLHVDRSISNLEAVTVIAAPSLVGVEGPLPSSREKRLAVPGVGPLRAEIVCRSASGEEAPPVPTSRCAADASVELRLSDNVATRDLARHLVVAPLAGFKLPEVTERTSDVDLSSHMNLVPGRKYRVTVKAGLRAEDKEVLAEDQVLDFEIADHVPSIAWRDIGPEAVVESSRATFGLHLSTMNVPRLEAAMVRLDDAQLVDILFGDKVSTSRVRALPGSAPADMTFKVQRNVASDAVLGLPPSVRAPGATGFFAVATRTPGLDDDVRVLSVTNLGVSTKWSPHGGVVWVTRLSDASPVAGADVSVVRAWRAGAGARATATETFVTRTDPGGIAEIPSQVAATFLGDPDHAEALLYVRDGTDRTYARLPRLSEHAARVIGDLFTDRKLYRPGETAFVKGIFRAPTPRGLVSLVGRAATLEVIDDEDRIVFANVATLDAFGSFSSEVPIPKTARLGRTSLRARLGSPLVRSSSEPARRTRHWAEPGWHARASFTIDEFRTVEFEVKAASDRASADRSESVRFTASGRYLLGAPMHGVPVELSVMRSRTTFRPPGLEEFITDPYGIASQEGPGSAETPPLPKGLLLDANGAASFALPLALAGQLGPETLRVDAMISDVSGAFGSGDTTSVLVHNADLYVGVRAFSYAPIFAGRTVRAEVLAASVDGTRRTGSRVHV